jgi:flagellar hook-associated protein 1 FlgK
MSSGLIGSIYKNAQALNYHQRNVEIAGNNLANVNNPEYARQRTILKNGYMTGSRYGLETSAIESDGLQHLRDQLLDKQIIKEISTTESLREQADLVNLMTAVIAEEIRRAEEPQSLDGAQEEQIDTGTVTRAIDRFFNAWHELSADPSNIAAKQVVYSEEESLIQTFNVTGQRLDDLKTSFSTLNTTANDKIDALINEIVTLNQKVAKTEFLENGQAVTYRDDREAAIEELAQYMDVTFEEVAGTNGMWKVTAGSTNTVLIDATGKKAFTKFADISSSITYTGGKLHAYAKVNSTTGSLTSLISNFNALTNAIVTSVNAAYTPGFFNTANTTMSKISFADGITGASSIVASASSATSPGANELALAVAIIKDKTTLTGLGDQNMIDFVTAKVAEFGASGKLINDNLAHQEDILSALKERRQEVSGVSIDEEVASMMAHQRAFQASSRVITTIDSLLDIVVNGLIR